MLPESVCSQSAPTASTSACTATAGKVSNEHKEQGKRLPLQETVQEQAKSTPNTLEKDQALSSCTMNEDVLGPMTFGTSSCFYSQALHIVKSQ